MVKRNPKGAPTELPSGNKNVRPDSIRRERGGTLAQTAMRYVGTLTPRQRQIFEMILDGHPNRNMAADLGISLRTVENHRRAIMQKTHTKSLPDLVRLALTAQLFSAEDPFELGDESNFYLDVAPITAVARAMFEHAPGAMMMVDHKGFILHMNPASEQLFGYREAELLGKPIEVLLPVALRDHHRQLREDFLNAPAIREMSQGRTVLARRSDGHEISVDVGLRPLLAGGRPLIVLLPIVDNSVRQRAERAELFIRELTHRAKNILAVILSISRQISKSSSDVKNFELAFEERLTSFAATYRLFEEGEGSGALINDLVRSQLSLFNGGALPQVQIEGLDLWLPGRLSETLGLGIHELATNAVKYGALSVDDGVVEVRWGIDPDTRLFRFDWIERLGPPVVQAARSGFGSVVLKHVVPSAFGGVATFGFTPAGFIWHLEAPLADIERTRT